MSINQKRAGVVMSYIAQAIHIIASLVYTPVMLRLLGSSDYGLYQLVNSVVSYLGIINLGFGSAYMRFRAKAEKDGDRDEVARLNGMFMIIFTVITLIVLFCGAVMVINIRGVFGTGLTEEEYPRARFLMVFMVIGLATTMFGTVFTSNLTAHEEFVFQRLLEILQNLFNPLITLPLLLAGYGSVGMVVVSTALVTAKFLASLTYCFKKLHIRFSFRHLRFSILKELGTFTFFIFLNLVIDRINWSLDKFLIGRFCGTGEVSVYGIAANLLLMYQSFCSAISAVFVPKVNRLAVSGNNDTALTKIFTKVGRMQFLIAYLIVSGYTVFGHDFITLWAGDKFLTPDQYLQSYIVGLLLMIPATMELIQYMGIEIQRAKNKHKARSVVYFCISIANVGISIPLIKSYGAVGAALGTAIALFLGNWLFMNYYYHKKIGLNIFYYWKNIFKFLPAVLITAVCGYLINRFCNTGTWLSLFGFIAVYGAVYAVTFFLIGLNREEKTMLFTSLNKLLPQKLKFKKYLGEQPHE